MSSVPEPSESPAERKLRAMFNYMVDAFAYHRLIVDDAGQPIDYVFLEVNPAFERETGLRRDELVGRRVTEVLPGIERDPADWIGRYGRVVATGEPTTFENYSAGLGKWFSVTAYSPEPMHFAVIFEDITAREAARRDRESLIADLETKNAELERFLYTVFHDLRSPMITIRAFAEAVMEDLDGGDVAALRDDARRICKASERMHGLIEDLLRLARVGRVVGEPERVDLGALCADVVGLLAGPIRRADFTVDVPAELPTVYGDRVRIGEVFQNLIENAIKFRGAVAPRAEIRATREGAWVRCVVRDNGVGLDPRFQGQVFELFEKAHPEVEGAGVGLAIVRRIVSLHGGEVRVESAGEGQGTSFEFTLPAPPDEAPPG